VSSRDDHRQRLDLLESCTVEIHGARFAGTGFFVGPGTVLSCAHVLRDAGPTPRIVWAGQELTVSAVSLVPADGPNLPFFGFPDLAVVAVEEDPAHGVLWLGQNDPVAGDSLVARGFSRHTLEDGVHRDGLIVTVAGPSARFLRVKDDQIVRGLSGSPLMDPSTGLVRGIVKASRQMADERGGWIIPVSAIRQYLPAEFAANQALGGAFVGGGERPTCRISNLPARNPTFAGRADLLTQIEARVRRSPLVLNGLGGIGKTELALEFAHRAWDSGAYDIVWWVRADPVDALGEDLASLARRLELPVAAGPTETQDALLAELGGRGRWLLVYDGAEGPPSLDGKLPTGGHILITSRERRWGRFARSIPVPLFDTGESTDFLLARTDLTETEAAAELAEELGHLPLALAQAAAYIEGHRLPIARYLELLRSPSAKARLLREGLDPAEYRGSIATTWQLHFDQLRSDNPSALQLLRLCSFLHPDAINVRDLVRDPWLLPHPLARMSRDAFELEQAVGELISKNLISRIDAETLRVHRLVQDAVHIDIGEDALLDWETYADQLVHALHPYPYAFDDPGYLVPYRLHGGHLQHHTWDKYRESSLVDRLVSMGPARRARYENHQNITDFEYTMECQLRLTVAFHGASDPGAGSAWLNLGIARLYSGNDDGARQAFDTGFAVLVEAYGNDHPNLAEARQTVTAAQEFIAANPVEDHSKDTLHFIVREDMLWEAFRAADTAREDGTPFRATDGLYTRMVWQDVLSPSFHDSLGDHRVADFPALTSDSQRLNEILRPAAKFALKGADKPVKINRVDFLPSIRGKNRLS
jgi:hypothetical protein